ncbi:MAG: hypothetical protein QW786_00120 [Candidatus Hadarchaeum sp.]
MPVTGKAMSPPELYAKKIKRVRKVKVPKFNILLKTTRSRSRDVWKRSKLMLDFPFPNTDIIN